MPARNQPKPNGKKAGRPGKQAAKPKKPLGWLPVPPEVEKQVRESMKGAPENEIRDQINEETLSYYYGGDVVLVRMDERGVEVIAAGDDVGPAVRTLTPEQRQIYGMDWPIVWGGMIL